MNVRERQQSRRGKYDDRQPQQTIHWRIDALRAEPAPGGGENKKRNQIRGETD